MQKAQYLAIFPQYLHTKRPILGQYSKQWEYIRQSTKLAGKTICSKFAYFFTIFAQYMTIFVKCLHNIYSNLYERDSD